MCRFDTPVVHGNDYLSRLMRFWQQEGPLAVSHVSVSGKHSQTCACVTKNDASMTLPEA